MKPILFNIDMVRSILDGKKTQTRRVIKPQPIGRLMGYLQESTSNRDNKYYGCPVWEGEELAEHTGCFERHYRKPRYQIGDTLYVRETFLKSDEGYRYKADETIDSEQLRIEYGYKWKPSIHMPKEAARVFLKVTDVRVERLGNMSFADIMSEGIQTEPMVYDGRLDNLGIQTSYALKIQNDCRKEFVTLWNSIYEKKGYGWDINPWVWVYEFKKIERSNND